MGRNAWWAQRTSVQEAYSSLGFLGVHDMTSSQLCFAMCKVADPFRWHQHAYRKGSMNTDIRPITWRGAQNKALSDTWCNVKFSLCFTSKYKAIWKANLVVNQTSLRAFFHTPLHLIRKSHLPVKSKTLPYRECNAWQLLCNLITSALLHAFQMFQKLTNNLPLKIQDI